MGKHRSALERLAATKAAVAKLETAAAVEGFLETDEGRESSDFLKNLQEEKTEIKKITNPKSGYGPRILKAEEKIRRYEKALESATTDLENLENARTYVEQSIHAYVETGFGDLSEILKKAQSLTLGHSIDVYSLTDEDSQTDEDETNLID